MKRIVKAFGYTWDGFYAALKEPAFFQEFILAVIFIPVIWLLPVDPVYKMAVSAAHLLTFIVELLNTGIEKIADLVSPNYHELVKKAKDMGSAAVAFAFLILFICWGTALWTWLY